MGQKVAKGVHYVMGDPPVLTEEDVLVERRGVVWNVDGTLKSCIYCDYASKKKEKEILYADDLVVIFAPRKKAAKQHVLVVPHQRHITQIGEFFSSDVHVLDHMRSVTEDFMKKNGADPESKIQMSFFISPWNSVDHVHMHALEQPFNSLIEKGRFAEGAPWCVSFGNLRDWVGANKDIPDDDQVHPIPVRLAEEKSNSRDLEHKEALGDEEKSAEAPVMPPA